MRLLPNNSQLTVLAVTLIGLSLTVTFNQCSDISFEKPSASKAEIVNTPDGTKVYQQEHTFTRREAKPVDVIWVVDNSGSMSAESAHVRNNIVSFANKISNAADMTMSLISATSGKNFVDYPSIAIPNLKINQKVSSHDGLELLTAAICPPQSNFSFCHSSQANSTVKSQLYQFLRPQSHKVVVIVTDDESDIEPMVFTDLFDSVYGLKNLTVYGWVGLGGKLSPCQASTGHRYISLSQTTGGKVFNVCDNDWSTHFDSLAGSIITLVGQTISLPPEILSSEIISIHLNGKLIDPSLYSIKPTGLSFSPAVIEGLETGLVRIEFKPQ